jgi:fructokinase
MPGHVSRAIGIGELVWDLLPSGPRLGGAPFNTIAHLARFGWGTEYVTAVGRDRLGEAALEELRRIGVSTSLVQVSDRPTGIVRVDVDAAGMPAYEIVSPAAYEALVPLAGDALELASRVDVVVFGTLAQRFPGSREATRRIVERSGRAVRLYDVNLRPGCWDATLVDDLVKVSTVVKLNDLERAALDLPGEPIEQFARAMVARYRPRGVCVTRGAAGAALLLDDVYGEAPAPRVHVVDTVGAGDAFSAALVHGLIEDRPVSEILEVATRLAALVSSRAGAIPAWTLGELGIADQPVPRVDHREAG